MDNGPLISVTVALTEHFKARYRDFPNPSRKKISAFIAHVRVHGFDGLEGRNKFSDDVSRDDADFVAKVQYVRLHCLWHYHVGIHIYDPENTTHGDRTSMFVLHYKRDEPTKITIADLSPHPPFKLPTLEMFT